MNKYIKYIIITLVLILNYSVYAGDNCASKQELEALANKVEYLMDSRIIKEPGEGEKDVEYAVYDIEFLNVSDNLAIQYGYSKDEYDYVDSSNKILDEPQGSTLYIQVVASGPKDCAGEVLKSFTIKLLDYNPNSKSEICKENPNFTYCKEFINSKTDLNNEDEFKEKLDDYNDNKKRNSETVQGNEVVSYDNNVAYLAVFLIPMALFIFSWSQLIKEIKENRRANYLGV